MTRVVLVNTRQENFQAGIFSLGNSRKNQPLDLALIAAILEVNSLKVQIIDANLYQISHQQVAKKIAEIKPGWIIINTASLDRWECPLPTIEQPKLLSSAIKQESPNFKVIAIGPHGTVTPNWVMNQCPTIDYLIRGEPEITVKELISQNRPGLGVSYRHNKQVIHLKDRPFLDDLDRLPIPAYHQLPMADYGPLSDHFNGTNLQGQTFPFSIMLTSRGCPGQCTFCFKKMFQQQKTFRSQSPLKVVTEMSLLSRQYGVRAIYFQDLNFCTNQQRVTEICNLILAKKLDLSWGCEARFDNLNYELAKLMKLAGCSFVNFGLESGSEKIIQLCQKNISVSIAEKAIADCQKANLGVGVFKLLGLSGETKQTFEETLEFMIRNQLPIPYPFPLNIPIPYPGTVLHRQAEQQFKIKINWENAPLYAGRVGTDFFNKVSPTEIQRLAYEYKLKQNHSPKNRHYFKLLALDKITKFKGLPKRLSIS